MDYQFEGPYKSTVNLKSASGVYVIHYENQQGQYVRLDAGESSDVKDRVNTHDRKACWERNAKGTLTVSVYYCNEIERMRIEKYIRSNSNLPCGKI